MFWAEKLASQIIQSGQYKPYHVDDMFTPSGFAHAGSLRGPLIHDFVYRALKDKGQEVEFTFVFNDFDPIDGLPPELEKKFSKFLGFPLKQADSPDPNSSFADYFADDFKNVLEGLGARPKFLSSWDLYHDGKFDEVIKEALDSALVIQDIYQEVAGSKKREQGWLPLQVICEKCKKLGTTKVYDWDGETVAYVCEPALAKWTAGCGHDGRISPFRGNGKLPWKVDWPAHWKVLGVTIEGEGKDHASAGGSRDIANALCRQVFNYPIPFDIPYEFFLFGGKKMSSSGGLGIRARDLPEILPSELIRSLFARTDYRQAIEFNPIGTMAIPDLFDEYDRFLREKKRIFLPRFRDVANYVQFPDVKLEEKFAEEKGDGLTAEDLGILKERQKYAQIWLTKYAPEEYKMLMANGVPDLADGLSPKQKQYLARIIDLLSQTDPEKMQVSLYNLANEIDLPTKDAFAAIYISFLGKDHGPKAGWFLLQYPKDRVIERIKEVSK